MRATFVLFGCLALILGACSSKKPSNAPPPLDKSRLTGKWKSASDSSFLAGYDFAEDGTVKMKLLGMKEPVPGRYSWSGDRTLELEYSKEANIQKAYEEAAKAYKDEIKERIEKKELDGRAGPSMMAAVADKLPATETYKVGLSDPRFLVLTHENGSMQNFDKAD